MGDNAFKILSMKITHNLIRDIRAYSAFGIASKNDTFAELNRVSRLNHPRLEICVVALRANRLIHIT